MNDLCGEYPVTLYDRHVGTLSVIRNGLFTEFTCQCRCSPEEVPRLICVSGGNSVCVGVPIYNSGVLTLFKKYSKNALLTAGFSDTISDCFLSFGIVGGKPPEPVPDRKLPIEIPAEPELRTPVIQLFPETPALSPSTIVTMDVYPEPLPTSDTVSLPVPPKAQKSPAEPPAWSVDHEPSLLFYSPELSAACRSVTGALTRKEGDITLLAVPVSSDEPFPMLPVFCFGEPWIIGSRDYIVFRIKNGELTAG